MVFQFKTLYFDKNFTNIRKMLINKNKLTNFLIRLLVAFLFCTSNSVKAHIQYEYVQWCAVLCSTYYVFKFTFTTNHFCTSPLKELNGRSQNGARQFIQILLQIKETTSNFFHTCIIDHLDTSHNRNKFKSTPTRYVNSPKLKAYWYFRLIWFYTHNPG